MMLRKSNYCEACKFQFNDFPSLQKHIRDYHDEGIGKPPPVEKLRDGTPAPQRITTMSPEELLANNLEMSAMVQRAYKLRREGDTMILTKEFKQLPERQKLMVRGALSYLPKKIMIQEEE